MFAQAALAVALTLPSAAFKTNASAADAVAAGGDDSAAALKFLRSRGKRGLWALNDIQAKKRGAERGRLLEAMGWFRIDGTEWALRKGLKAGSSEARAGAIRGFGHLKSKGAAKLVTKSAGSKHAVVRDAVAQAMVELGKLDQDAWAFVAGDNKNAKLTGFAYLTLRKSDRLSDQAIPKGLEDSDVEIKLAAIQLAAARGGEVHAAALERLARSKDARVAVAAVDALAAAWALGTPRRLSKIVSDADASEVAWRKAFQQLRAKGAKGYAGMTDGMASAPDDRREILKNEYVASMTDDELQWTLDLLAHPRRQTKRLGRSMLKRVGQKAEDGAIARLAGADMLVTKALTAYLKEQPRDRVGQKLLNAANKGTPEVRAGAVGVIASIGGKENLAGLIPMLKDDSPVVRAAAARAIGKGKGKQFEAALAESLKDPDAKVRVAALDGLARRKSNRRAKAMIVALDDADENVRLRAIEKLSGPKDVAVLDALEGRLRNGPEEERTEIVKAISASKLPQAAALMVQLVTDPDRAVRRAALKAIEEE